MTVKVTGVDSARAQLRAINDFLASPKPMEGIVKDIKDIVIEKTESGHDFMGRNFAPLSPGYARRTGKSKADLVESGTMLGAIKTEVIDPRHGAVFVSGASEPGGRIRSDMLAQVHNTGTGTMPQREFMNLAPSAVQKLKKKHYDDPIGALAKAARGR